MIISKTPLRVSLFGGGSDISTYYEMYGGEVLSFAINRFVYVTVHTRFDSGFRISYSKHEEADSVKDIQHPLVRNCLEKLRYFDSLEITSIGEIPSKGSGLGSSSAFTVGLLNALHKFIDGEESLASTLASEACEVEIDMSNELIGKQDQYACAFGGMNRLFFQPDGSVGVNKIDLQSVEIKKFTDQLLLVFTGQTRDASILLTEQFENFKSNSSAVENLHLVKEFVNQAENFLRRSNFDSIGLLLDKAWEAKKKFHANVTNEKIDYMYSLAKKNGALGGKILGAGGGGFLLLYAEKEAHPRIRKALSGSRFVDFSVEEEGSRILNVN